MTSTSNSSISECNLHLYGNRQRFEELFQVLNHKHEKKKAEATKQNTIEITSNSKVMQIFTKYYETKVNLNFIENIATQLDHQTNGFIVYLDNNRKYLEDLSNNKSSLEALSPEKYLKLILVENLNSLANKSMLDKLTDEHDFNIIELNLKNESQEEEEDGVDELLNALYVHEWSIMRKVGELQTQQQQQEQTSATTKDTETEAPPTAASAEQFENILSNLQDLRSQALKMDPNDRKLFAQDIVTKFWSSIGGDADELEGLSDLSDIE